MMIDDPMRRFCDVVSASNRYIKCHKTAFWQKIFLALEREKAGNLCTRGNKGISYKERHNILLYIFSYIYQWVAPSSLCQRSVIVMDGAL